MYISISIYYPATSKFNRDSLESDEPVDGMGYSIFSFVRLSMCSFQIKGALYLGSESEPKQSSQEKG